jgi:hypothetical protein
MDCQTVVLLLGLALGYGIYRIVDKNFQMLFTGGMWIIRAIFIAAFVGAILVVVDGPTLEILVGAAWAAFEVLGFMVQSKKRQARYYEDVEEDD